MLSRGTPCLWTLLQCHLQVTRCVGQRHRAVTSERKRQQVLTARVHGGKGSRSGVGKKVHTTHRACFKKKNKTKKQNKPACVMKHQGDDCQGSQQQQQKKKIEFQRKNNVLGIRGKTRKLAVRFPSA